MYLGTIAMQHKATNAWHGMADRGLIEWTGGEGDPTGRPRASILSAAAAKHNSNEIPPYITSPALAKIISVLGNMQICTNKSDCLSSLILRTTQILTKDDMFMFTHTKATLHYHV